MLRLAFDGTVLSTRSASKQEPEFDVKITEWVTATLLPRWKICISSLPSKEDANLYSTKKPIPDFTLLKFHAKTLIVTLTLTLTLNVF